MEISRDEKDDDSPLQRMQELRLNTDEPWERSLLRLLQDAQPSNIVTPNAEMAAHYCPTAELTLLERSESRDYAHEINVQHDDSTTTLSRTTSPFNRSSIYRAAEAAHSFVAEGETGYHTDSGRAISDSSAPGHNDNADQVSMAEARGEQNASGREMNRKKLRSANASADGKRSFLIFKATAVREDDDDRLVVRTVAHGNDSEQNGRSSIPDLLIPLLL